MNGRMGDVEFVFLKLALRCFVTSASSRRGNATLVGVGNAHYIRYTEKNIPGKGWLQIFSF